MKFPRINPSPTARISIGLVALIVGWIMLVDMLVGIWPDQRAMQKELRERASENLAIQAAALLRYGDAAELAKTLEEAVRRDNQIYSVAIRTKQGETALQVGDHERYWKPSNSAQSTLDYVRVEIKAGHQPWGDLEVAFRPASPQTAMGWARQPMAVPFLLLVLGGLVLYWFYLRRVFIHLDPSSVIPDRVRVAFDNFSEGVMMLDRTGHIVLANKALRNWVEEKNSRLFGKNSQDLPWLKAALHEDPKNYPWVRAMEIQRPINGLNLEFHKANGEMIKAVVNCSPIQDAANHVRGCLVTFDNVTELDRINKKLISTMEELSKSQEEIEKQNVELRKLATHDPLTNCLNRRAFFEQSGQIFGGVIETKRPLSCIMTDIDHFKLFNDRYGHAVGDKVLIAFSRTLFSGLRADDLLARYGGEEFCILLQDAAPELAFSIAERLRAEVELHAGASIRSTQELKITASFGIATRSEGTTDLAALIDQADQALYAAKNGGRNCVKTWGTITVEASQEPAPDSAAPPQSNLDADQHDRT